MNSTKSEILSDVDFRRLNSKDFKEDSVREVIILPILKYLGYSENDIVRSKSLMHPFLKIGSKKRPITLIPDYLLKVLGNYAWVLDAKNPDEEITNGENVEQVYSYSIHPEIRAKYFALCNGKQFVLFKQDVKKPILNFNTKEIKYYLDKLLYFLSPNSFQIGKSFNYDNFRPVKRDEKFEYLNRPLLEEIQVRKQAAKRHFGCNAYFTRQSWDIVNAYISNFSQPGDLIFDPFAGSGVTAIEALMLDRKAIHIDLNPLSVFIVNALAAPVNISEFVNEFNKIKTEYLINEPKSNEEIKDFLKIYPYPQKLKLPKGSDVDYVEDLFTEEQIAQLAFLKFLIKKIKNLNIQNSLFLAFYNTVSIINKTFHDTPKGGGNHFGYYYRYRIAPKPAKRNTIQVFEGKFKRVLEGKKELQSKINDETINNLVAYKGSATKLNEIKNETVDYIYTDPPYGSKIAYLDLSIIWNSWLDLEVTKKDLKNEAIVGGEQNKSKEEYNSLIADSIKEMYRVLKFNRWMSFVFAHKDPEFWHLIIDSAEEAGFEYVGAIPQKNGQSSFKKRQNPFTILSGELIINFKKVKTPKAILKANFGVNIAHIIIETIEGVIAANNGATLEQINDELIVKGLEFGFLDLLKKEYSDLTPLLTENFEYNEKTGKFTIHQNKKFKTNIDDRLRIKYYLYSYLMRMEAQKKSPTFDEIITYIMPLLRNGHTPENQTILNILEDIGEHSGEGRWRLKHTGQTSLFF